MTFSRDLGPYRGDPHGWNTLDHYLAIHDSCLDDWRDHFVVHDTLTYETVGDSLRIVGRIVCAYGLFIDVDKTLEINDRNQVRTRLYAYHAGVAGDVDRALFRYDNAHSYAREGHADEHHRHRFDHRAWSEIRPPEWIGHARWPLLSDVIVELADWWFRVGQFLDELQ